jgi:hypothetical protein
LAGGAFCWTARQGSAARHTGPPNSPPRPRPAENRPRSPPALSRVLPLVRPFVLTLHDRSSSLSDALVSAGPLQVPKIVRCAHRASEQFLRFSGLACVPWVNGAVNQSPEWLLGQLLRGREHSTGVLCHHHPGGQPVFGDREDRSCWSHQEVALYRRQRSDSLLTPRVDRLLLQGYSSLAGHVWPSGRGESPYAASRNVMHLR